MNSFNTTTNDAAPPIATLSAAATAHFADHGRITMGAGMRRVTVPLKPPVHLRDLGTVKFGGGI
jgi:hypothetical protein